MSLPPYSARAAALGLTPLDEVKTALADPSTVVLDVRSPDEIAASATLPQSQQTGCTADECPNLSADPTQFAGTNKGVTIVVYCRSGKRASKAQQILQEHGYTRVLNAGGYDDVATIL